MEREEGQVENWNDDRLDELSRRMDAGFKEMRDGFARVDERLDRMGDGLGSRIDRLFYIQIAFMASLAIGVLTDKI